jgi:hypothetical protein
MKFAIGPPQKISFILISGCLKYVPAMITRKTELNFVYGYL